MINNETQAEVETPSLAEKLEQKLHDTCERYEHIHEQVDDLSKALVKTIRKKPLTTLGIAVVCGIVIGKMLK